MPVEHYIYDGQNILEETDEFGTLQASYTYEPEEYGELISQHRGSKTSYYHYDALGSTRQLTDETETVTDTYTYNAWGEIIQQTGTTTNPFRWIGNVGYYFDEETQDYYVRARYYQPICGRWLCKDPIGFLAGPNIYLYAHNMPALGVDPSGLKVVCCHCQGYRDGIPAFIAYQAVVCLNSTLDNCCKKECKSVPCSIPISHSNIPPSLPTAPRKKKKPQKPTPLKYGHYCGFNRRASCKKNKCAKSCFSRSVPNYDRNPAPIDKLDAICERHDCCLADLTQIVKCANKCHEVLCPQVEAVSCQEEYPEKDQTNERYACELMKKRFLDTFC